MSKVETIPLKKKFYDNYLFGFDDIFIKTTIDGIINSTDGDRYKCIILQPQLI